MGNSFQDQLLKAGLVSKKQVKKARHEKRVSRQQKPKSEPPRESSIAREERLAHEQHNRELNQQRNAEKKRRENAAQIKQLIKSSRLTLEARDDDEPYHFIVKKRIKKLFVPEKIIRQISSGQLAIVNLDGKYELVPGHVARQIADRDQKSLVVFHDEN